jgi:hypothetical protein
MFRENTKHMQKNLYGFENELDETRLKRLQRSEYRFFYDHIHSQIDEEIFRPLYCCGNGTPNAPVNSMVSALILQHKKNWTYEELFDRIYFDLLMRTALGLDTLEKVPFCPATLFNFQNRMNEHFIETGENLLERVFDGLTAKQLKELKIKTDIQRSDSFLIGSNIRKYGRLQVLVEVLIRLHRVLSDEDRERFKDEFSAYLKQSSGQYLYRLRRGGLEKEMEKIGECYRRLYEGLKPAYADVDIFLIFERVYGEHFRPPKKGEKIEVKSTDELGSGCLQSPDDVDATYRKKKAVESRGQVVNVTETCNPDNKVNLLNDIGVEANNVDDSKILSGRIEGIKEKTPELNELHTDGGYGSADNDRKMEKCEINHVQTAIKGHGPEVDIRIEQKSDGEYEVSCPHQTVGSEPGRRRHKACFDGQICDACENKEKCPTTETKTGRTYYFVHDDYLADKRRRRIDELPSDRKSLRNNVEASVKEFKNGKQHGKLRVRGRFKTEVFAYAKAMGINFGRIYRYLLDNLDDLPETLSGIIARTRNAWRKMIRYQIFSFCSAKFA